MKTKDITEATDRHYPTHACLVDWVERECPSKKQWAKQELALLYRRAEYTGEFTINLKRFKHGFSRGYYEMWHVLNKCPYIQQTSVGRKGCSAGQYKFKNLPGAQKREPDNGREREWKGWFVWGEKSNKQMWSSDKSERNDENGKLKDAKWEKYGRNGKHSDDIRVEGQHMKTIVATGEFRTKRAIKWQAFCDKEGYQNKVDYLACREETQYLFDVFERIRFPDDPSFLQFLSGEMRKTKEGKDKMSVREACAKYWERATSGKMIRKCVYTDGRIYHTLSGCPKQLRWLMQIDGCPVLEADLNVSYFAYLASLVREHADRKKSIEAVTSGEFRERLQDMAGTDFTENELKNEIMRMLFRRWRDPEEVYPLDEAFRREFPGMWRASTNEFNRVGCRGLSRMLTQGEGAVMSEAHRLLRVDGTPYIPNQDGIISKNIDIEKTVKAIETAGLSIFGFTPRVETKPE
ncbi:hypothetical protein [Aporhodopirellula aestuarii]|uniref:Uncharacterized protein n=1 Tax=Aporhodopirellula aestuarii TaxID=2950107 RepID=A0ABT0U3D6_9BACT|nr:hypothetical protein [Aporhodopirellula aestuarii]MCM2371095.1 hypothetical protein [Aporhodopirellula aestuarii]